MNYLMAKKQDKKEEVEMERIPIAVIYKTNGKIHIDTNKDEINLCEFYGFLSVYIDMLRDTLYEDMSGVNNSE